MDVILLQDVERLGSEGGVVKVKPGFARNYLFPRGLAVSASPQELKAFEERQRATDRKVKRQREEAERLKRKLEGLSLTLQLTLGEGDKPFGSITIHDIVQALKQEGHVIEKHTVQLPEPIKVLGIYQVPIKVHPEVSAVLKLWVVKA